MSSRPTIAEFAKQTLGIELLPWQREAAAAIERGEHTHAIRPQQSGKATFKRIVEQWQAAIKKIEGGS